MEWLKRIRLQENKTQKMIADEIGITDGFYSMIENGSRRPSPQVAKRIADILGFRDEWYRLLEATSNSA
jgi:transcriptional regulator with XRE-family HTH domain